MEVKSERRALPACLSCYTLCGVEWGCVCVCVCVCVVQVCALPLPPPPPGPDIGMIVSPAVSKVD